MKLKIALFAVLAFSLQPSAFSQNAITNYFPGYVCTTSGWQTVAESGLATNTPYACIPLSAMPAATAAALSPTGTTSDVRIFLFAIQDAAYTNYLAMDATNRPANATLTKTITLQGTQYRIRHQLDTAWSFVPILTLE
jgi:hypothetical protein